ncbi:MAG: SDR family NAD(P)-dependent oxidoreductase [Flavisolibacter sp.]|nr:SDR family NAD(P)-dependent oxidoreductase [Flavisolibacter sp.]
MKKDEFRDKEVVITGASGGIGRATAWEFAKQGAKVALLARSTEQLECTKKEKIMADQLLYITARQPINRSKTSQLL